LHWLSSDVAALGTIVHLFDAGQTPFF
jgi:hypothetical protein